MGRTIVQCEVGIKWKVSLFPNPYEIRRFAPEKNRILVVIEEIARVSDDKGAIHESLVDGCDVNALLIGASNGHVRSVFLARVCQKSNSLNVVTLRAALDLEYVKRCHWSDD